MYSDEKEAAIAHNQAKIEKLELAPGLLKAYVKNGALGNVVEIQLCEWNKSMQKYLKVSFSYQTVIMPYSQQLIDILQQSFHVDWNFESKALEELKTEIRIEVITADKVVRYADTEAAKKEKATAHVAHLKKNLESIQNELKTLDVPCDQI